MYLMREPIVIVAHVHHTLVKLIRNGVPIEKSTQVFIYTSKERLNYNYLQLRILFRWLLLL